MSSASPRSQFAQLLRAARDRRGLTQEEFAGRSGIGVRTLRDLERGRAKPHRATVELLIAALGASGAERESLLEASGRASAVTVPTLHLPPRPALIGRESEVAALRRALRSNRLTTLVGVAGVGKTSLAIEVAHAAAAEHTGGTSAIAVTEVSTEADITTAVAAAFDIARAVDLAAGMANRDALLLLDGVERAPTAVAGALMGLASAAPSLCILATSRHPIGRPGERVWPITPLEVPAPDAVEPHTYPAVALLKARLEAVRSVPITASDEAVLVELVRRIGGLPLALELAAARGRILDPTELLHRYGDRVLDLGDSTSPESRTLRDAVGDSYRLLDRSGQHALRRLTAFRHRWSLEMAEPLLSGSAPDPVGVLQRLVDLGLVQIRDGISLRFRLLDVVREFAAEQRDEAGETEAIGRAHARVIAARVARIAPDLVGTDFLAAVRQLDEIAGDIRAALEFTTSHEPGTALALAAALPRWWRFRGRDREGRSVLRHLLDAPTAGAVPPATRAWAEVGAVLLALEHGDSDAELPRARSALATFAALDDVSGQLAAHNQLVALYHSDGAFDLARAHGEASLALATRAGRRRDQLVASTNLTWHDIRTGELAVARARLARVRTLAYELGEHRLESLALANLAEVERLDQRFEDAVRIGRHAARVLEKQGDPRHRRSTLGTVALALAESGRDAEAKDLLASLRAANTGSGDGIFAMIEAYLALRAGDRAGAARWFGAARQTLVGQPDVRDTVEALVGFVATASDPAAAALARSELEAVCRTSAVVLLPRDRSLLAGGA